MPQSLPARVVHDVGRILRAAAADTPKRFVLPSYASSLFKEAAACLPKKRKASGPDIVIAYSIKTNPLPELLSLARTHGMWAEAITQYEVAQALSHGIAPAHTVLNGPGKWWPAHLPATSYGAIFCDSLQELRALHPRVVRRQVVTDCLGVRLRPATVTSRFGIDLSDPRVFTEVVQILKRLPRGQGIGFHFHMASSMVGVRTWRYLAENFIMAVALMLQQIGARPATISFGGGWHPDDWTAFLRDDLRRLTEECRRHLPTVRRIILEPGKALSQRAMCLLTRVLEVRRGRERTELVVDGSIAELPDVRSHPHRIVSRNTAGKVAQWEEGGDRILGRLCMEFDILADTVRIPRHIKAGDCLAFLDAGAYDASMAYVFSRGFVPAVSEPGSL